MKDLSVSSDPVRGDGVSGSGKLEPKMELELSAYKRKVDQMTILLKHYQNELESQKVRRDGVETVSRLLAEARQENAVLKRNQVALETTVKNLQNRLAVNGLTSGSGMEDNEVIVPGTSKQTLTNLAMENKRLRSMLQKDTGSEINDDSLRKQSVTEDSELIEKLEAENKSMKKKLSDLEALFKSSNNEKDRQLVEYKEELQRLRQMMGSGSGSGKTVANLSGLREQLQAFISQCQGLESQLSEVQLEESTTQTRESTIELKPVTKQAVERTDSVDGVDTRQLLEEKQKLQDRVEEVTKMNQRWQEFFNERDRYTQSLEQKVQELEERLKQAMRSGPTEEINRRIEQVLEKSQKEQEQVEDLRRKAEEEVAQLRQEVATRDAQIAQLQSQVTILTRTTQQHSSAEASSTIEHLKAQIQVCTEDFEKERQDRQVALQKVASLQEQVNRLNKLNSHLQTLVCNQVGQAPRPAQEHTQCSHHDPGALQPRGTHYRYSALDYDGPVSSQSNDHWQDFPDFDYETPNRQQGFVAPGHMSMPGTTVELVARGPNPKPKHSLSDSALGPDAKKQENFLTCPKCNKEFSEERQGELLAHMDICWE